MALTIFGVMTAGAVTWLGAGLFHAGLVVLIAALFAAVLTERSKG